MIVDPQALYALADLMEDSVFMDDAPAVRAAADALSDLPDDAQAARVEEARLRAALTEVRDFDGGIAGAADWVYGMKWIAHAALGHGT